MKWKYSFNFLKRSGKKEAQKEDIEFSSGNTRNRHHNFGQDVAKLLTDNIDSHISSRILEVKIKYFKYLQEKLEYIINQKDESPLLLAKDQYEYLVENSSLGIEKLCKEIMVWVDEDWTETLKFLSLEREMVIKLIHSKVTVAFHSFTSDGLEVIEERADRLKAAESIWQQKS